MLTDHIKNLEKELELEGPLRREAEGVYILPVDEGVEVVINDLAPGYGFHCALSVCPEGDEEPLFTRALLANLMGQGTEGAILGLDEEGQVMTLAFENVRSGDYRCFLNDLEDFLNGVDFWRAEINPA